MYMMSMTEVKTQGYKLSFVEVKIIVGQPLCSQPARIRNLLGGSGVDRTKVKQTATHQTYREVVKGRTFIVEYRRLTDADMGW